MENKSSFLPTWSGYMREKEKGAVLGRLRTLVCIFKTSRPLGFLTSPGPAIRVVTAAISPVVARTISDAWTKIRLPPTHTHTHTAAANRWRDSRSVHVKLKKKKNLTTANGNASIYLFLIYYSNPLVDLDWRLVKCLQFKRTNSLKTNHFSVWRVDMIGL